MGLEGWDYPYARDDERDGYRETEEPQWLRIRNLEERITQSRDFMKLILEEIYGKGDFDAERLQWHLEEAAEYLEVRMPDGELQIERKRELAEV